MVCKEDVLSWFKDLEGYKRIDVMYELLNMCVPFELRFLGSCIEEIGKHSYQELRGPAINANDLERLSKDGALSQGFLDENVRHRVLVYLSLLSSRNYSVANWLYKNILRTDWLEDGIVKGNLKDENVQSEFLLLFVMALHHPAFTFEQKLYFSKILTQLIELRETKNRISPKPSVYGYPPGFGYPTIKTMNPPEVPIVPVKTSLTIPCGDDTLHQQPPGLPHVSPLQPPQEFVAWSIPGFPCGAPEVPPPFPLPAVSPLVSESTSPNHSRSTSPHRTMVPIRPAPPPQPQRPMEPITTQLPLDPLSSNNFPFLHPPENVKIPEEDLNSIPEEKAMLEGHWLPLPLKEAKQPNVSDAEHRRRKLGAAASLELVVVEQSESDASGDAGGDAARHAREARQRHVRGSGDADVATATTILQQLLRALHHLSDLHGHTHQVNVSLHSVLSAALHSLPLLPDQRQLLLDLLAALHVHHLFQSAVSAEESELSQLRRDGTLGARLYRPEYRRHHAEKDLYNRVFGATSGCRQMIVRVDSLLSSQVIQTVTVLLLGQSVIFLI